MHPEIERLIEMAISDGHVTEKEREIILRKAEKLGLDVDEVEMYLEGILESTNSNPELLNINQIKNDLLGNKISKQEINDSYIEKNDLLKVVDNISKFENKIVEIEQYYIENFNNWVNTEFIEIIKNHPKKIELDELNFLMNASSFLAGKKYREGQISDYFSSLINKEGFLGYFALDFSLINFDKLKNSSYTDNYRRFLFTTKGVYFFDEKIYDIINNRFICSGVLYDSIKTPEIYKLNIFNCSTNNVLYNLDFTSAECNHNDIMKNSGIEWTDKCYKLDFLGKSNTNSFSFLHLFSLNNINNISFDEIINNLNTEINYNKFKSVLNTNSLSEIQIHNLQKINNYIENILNNFNSFVSKKEYINYYNYLSINNRNSFSLDEFEKSLGHSVCTPRFNEDLKKNIKYYKYTMTHVIVILDLRDKLLNYYLTDNFVEANEIMLKIDNYGVFLTKYERTTIEKLEEINDSLKQLNNTLIEGFSMISESIQSLNNSLQDIRNSIEKVESTLDIGNFIQTIQTYQLYKINKNTTYFKNL